MKFQLQVRDAISDARKLQQSIEQAMQKAGLKPQLAPACRAIRRATPSTTTTLQRLYARVVDTPGIYTQPMLISQLNNIQRMVTQADQRIGRDAHERYADLIKEMQAIEAQLKKLGLLAMSDLRSRIDDQSSRLRFMCDFGQHHHHDHRTSAFLSMCRRSARLSTRRAG